MAIHGPSRLLIVSLLACLPLLSAAQSDYPTRPVRIIVPSSPGGGTDITTRRLLPGLTKELGQPVVVDNRAGAGGIIGNELAARAQPDGYTLLMGVATITILPSISRNLPYDLLKDLAPITQAVAAPNIMVVHPSLPVKSIRELIAFVRQRPGELNYASAGPGTNPHLAMELFLTMTNTKMVHIPYKGFGPAMADLLSGQVSAACATMLSSLAHVKSGRLRGLATTAATRAIALPDMPTVAEAGVKGYDVTQWYGLFAPAGTPRPIIARLNAAAVATLRAESARFAADGVEAVGNSPEVFRKVIESEMAQWAKAVRAAGMSPK
ncbi:MAG: tripartite tricarboxylate transporter substrate binding protein [Burkholderiales bacterium]|nr:tripartite tricarboxylate transporter substrate binding protein [Burkholderiales bacterium]